MKFSLGIIITVFLLFKQPLVAQYDPQHLINWQLKDPESKMPGVSADEAYKTILKGKPSYQVIVAVIDGGVDVQHEDLKQNIWVNPKEIPGNGKDDDQNGYIDDIYGWNFIGNASGANVHHDTYEATRTLGTWRKKYLHADVTKLDAAAKAEHQKYLDLEKNIEGKRADAEAQWKDLRRNETILLEVVDAVKKELGSLPLNKTNLERIDTTSNMYVNIGQKILLSVLEEQPYLNSFDQINQSIKQQYSGPRADLEAKFLYQYNADFDSRKIVGDTYENINERFYGNNDVKGPDAFHGTHVAGIIAAVRDNRIGMDGVAANVKIMALRAVPDGDERDKDVANSIRYAVDQGAKVINMSFGKGESPYKKAVDDAIRYAEKHDVLLVHASGNAGEDNDETTHYPVKTLDRKGLFVKKEVKNWLDVGALSFTIGSDMVASFSNYGKKSVDIFSPGVRIYSTAPDNNYEFADGTSMASPVMAGVAALIRSYYPKLSAKQVKKAILKNGNVSNIKVNKPGSSETVLLSQLCKSGSYVNAVKALEAASKMKGSKVFTGTATTPKA
ncbi:MAG: S8 family peptidase [Saprospiraceae bacterium]|nr:S8 family peptidase [Saprospiraceae bacterium]